MTKANLKKKDLIVLDFDNTMYHNPSYDLSLDIKPYEMVRAKDFFFELFTQTQIPRVYNPYFVLITGRKEDQRGAILKSLKQKGYLINRAYFNPTDQSVFLNNKGEIDTNKFLINYWCWKCMIINELWQSGRFSSITVIDDDSVICHMLTNLNITALKTEFIVYCGQLYLLFKEHNKSTKTFEIFNSDYKTLFKARDREPQEIPI